MVLMFSMEVLVRNSVGKELGEIRRLSQEGTDEICGIDRAAEIVGLSVATLYQLTARKEIPCSKPRKKLYFSKRQLTRWMLSAPVK